MKYSKMMNEPVFELIRDRDGIFSLSVKVDKDVIITDGSNFEELYSNAQNAFNLYLFDKPKIDWEYYFTRYLYQVSLTRHAFDLQTDKQYA